VGFELVFPFVGLERAFILILFLSLIMLMQLGIGLDYILDLWIESVAYSVT